MRLRFRGRWWEDGGAAVKLDTPSAASLGAPQSRRHSDPPQPLSDFLQGEGLELPLPFELLRRAQPSVDLSSWSCPAAVKRGWTAQREQLEAEKRGGEGTPAGCLLLRRENSIGRRPPVKSEEDAAKRHHPHPSIQNLPTSPACCVVVSDPTTPCMPEVSFPKAMLTDRFHREVLFSLTQDMLSAVPGISPPTAASKESVQRGQTAISPAGNIGLGRSLLELVPSREGKARKLSGPPPEKLAPKGAEKPRFEAITLDLDEEASAQLRKMVPGAGGTDCDRGDADSTYGRTEFHDVRNAAKTQHAPPSLWGALDLGRLMKAWPMQQHHRSVSTALPRPTHVKLSDKRRSGQLEMPPSTGIGRPAGDANDREALSSGNSCQAFSYLSDMDQWSVGGFTRLESPDGDEELKLHDTSPPKRAGLLNLLGSVRREAKLDAIGKARLDRLAGAGAFDLASCPGAETGPLSLLPGRFPSISMTFVVGHSWGRQRHQTDQGLDRATQNGSHLNGGSRLPSEGDRGSGQHKKSLAMLAPLWAALRKMEHIRSSRVSSPLLLELTPHRRLACARRARHVNALFNKNPVSSDVLSRHTRKPRESVAVITDKLVNATLESWRKAHAAHPAGRTPPQRKQAPPAPQLPPATWTQAASSQELPPAPSSTLPLQPAPTPIEAQAHSNSTISAVRRPKEVPANEGSDPRVPNRSTSLRPAARLFQGNAEGSSQRVSARASPIVDEGTEVGGDRASAASPEASRAGMIAGGQGAAKPVWRKKVPGNKRKLDRVLWSFGADSDWTKGRATPTSFPTTVGSSASEAKRKTMGPDRHGAGVVRRGGFWRRESSVSPGDGIHAAVVERPAPEEASAPSRQSFAATPLDSPIRRWVQGGGDGLFTVAASGVPGSSGRRKISEGSCGAAADADAGAFGAAHPSDESWPVELPSPSARTPERVVGNSAGALLSAPNDVPAGVLPLAASHVSPPRVAVVESANLAAGTDSAAHGIRPSSAQQEETSSGMCENGSQRPATSVASFNQLRRPTAAGKDLSVSTLGTTRQLASVSPVVRHEESPNGRGCGRGMAEEKSDEDAAMAGCESSRQREILAMIRAGAVGETFLLARGRRSTSGSSRKGLQLAPAPRGATTARRHSEPGGFVDGGVYNTCAAHPGDGASVRPTTISHQPKVPRPADRPLYAIVSEDFVGNAGTLLRTLSAPQAAPTAIICSSQAAPQSIALHGRRLEVEAAAPAGVAWTEAAGAASAVSRSAADGRFRLLELTVEFPVDLVIGSRSAVVILDNRSTRARGAAAATSGASSTTGARGGLGGGGSSGGEGAAAAAAAAAEEEVEAADAKEKLRLLQMQSLKYSTLWLIVRMDRSRVEAPPRDGGGGARLRPALEKLEQWLVGFPCRVLIRYSYSESQLAELITHAAATEQQPQQQPRNAVSTGGTGAFIAGAGNVSEPEPAGKRRRLGVEHSPVVEARPARNISNGAVTAPVVRSPLEVIDERSRADSDWASAHHRQAWFLQLFPALNAFSASALLSCASLKHLIVAPYDELAPGVLGRSGCGGGNGASGSGRSSSSRGAARGGVSAECLRDFCETVRLEGESVKS